MKEAILIVEDQFIEADYLRVMLENAGYSVTGIARSVAQAQEMIIEQRPGFVLLDIFLKGKQTGIELGKQLAEDNIPFVYLSANSHEDVLNEAKATQPYGFIVKPFREQDLLITLEIARYRHQHSLQSRAKKERELLKYVKDITVQDINWEEKLLNIARSLQPFIPFDYFVAGFDNIGTPSFSGISFLRVGFNEYQTIGLKELQVITGKTIAELIALQKNSVGDTIPAIYDEEAFRNICKRPSLQKIFADTFHLQSHLEMPMTISGNRAFSFCLYSRIGNAYTPEQLDLFERIQMPLILSIERMLGTRDPRQSSQRIASAKEKNSEAEKFDGIVGKNHLLLKVLDHINQVADSDTSVLVLGESGTGKELIANRIHNLSLRSDKPFVKVNCAALPLTLIESELFGHERGAFTGAMEKRIGKFEKADKGTIFLDEIGEMPLEVQVKLLRVLQEKEFDRVGGNDPIKIDVRVIAATNKNLEREVAEGRFRLDLYYRLNVFPVTMPALRDRKEDIPALAYYFMTYFNQKAGKKISRIEDDILNKMMAYHWPGNIRELRHLLERAVLLTTGSSIEEISLPLLAPEHVHSMGEAGLKTIHENERDYIIAVLKKCNGRIWGAGGAAEILNIHPSTLRSRMKKLGIRKEYIP
jgi:formate hydrogenlyase transcriptional activator